MHRLALDLTPGELAVLALMVDQILTRIQGDGSLSYEQDDNLASLNRKLILEIRNNR